MGDQVCCIRGEKSRCVKQRLIRELRDVDPLQRGVQHSLKPTKEKVVVLAVMERRGRGSLYFGETRWTTR